MSRDKYSPPRLVIKRPLRIRRGGRTVCSLCLEVLALGEFVDAAAGEAELSEGVGR